MGSPSPSLITPIMQFFVLLSAVSLAFAAPMPEGEEAPAALPYVHDATGDVAEPYVHEEIADVADEIAAVPYVHEEIEAAPYEHDATGDVAEVHPRGARGCPRCSRDIRGLPLRRSIHRSSHHLHRLCQQRGIRGALRRLGPDIQCNTEYSKTD